MKRPIFTKSDLPKWILFAIFGVLLAVVVLLSLQSRNVITRSRAEGDYMTVEDVTTVQLDGYSECTFVLGDIGHAETLAFYTSHHQAAVYVDGRCVYALTPDRDDVFDTVGNTWVMIPLYPSDEGKTVRVELTPLYDSIQTSTPEFLIGSEIAVHNVTFHRAIPALVLSLCVMFAGLLLICLAIYHSVNGMLTGRLYALGCMALSAGSWRLSYDRVAYMLFPNQTVTIYTVSVLSLMGVALSMINSLQTDKKGEKRHQPLLLLLLRGLHRPAAATGTGAGRPAADAEDHPPDHRDQCRGLCGQRHPAAFPPR